MYVYNLNMKLNNLRNNTHNTSPQSMILAYKTNPLTMLGLQFEDTEQEREQNKIDYEKIFSEFDKKNEKIKEKRKEINLKIAAKYKIGDKINYV